MQQRGKDQVESRRFGPDLQFYTGRKVVSVRAYSLLFKPTGSLQACKAVQGHIDIEFLFKIN